MKHPWHLIILYEDAERTLKLLHQLSSAPFFSRLILSTTDAGVDCGIIAAPNYTNMTSGSKGRKLALFSRCSGSYMSRQHKNSPAILQSILFAAEHTTGCAVFNGSSAFNIEMNKMLANLFIESPVYQSTCMRVAGGVHLRVPTSVAVTQLSDKLVTRALDKHGIADVCFIKALVGGGSTTVRRLDASDLGRKTIGKQLYNIRRDLKEVSNADIDMVIIQESAPSALRGVQYRFEIINKKVYYVVRIEQAVDEQDDTGHEVKNLCLCDIGEGDEGVSLRMIKNAGELSKEEGMVNKTTTTSDAAMKIFACVEQFAEAHNLHVVALEGTLHEGSLWVFDVNTNSNYNSELEKKNMMKPAAWHVIETMFT